MTPYYLLLSLFSLNFVLNAHEGVTYPLNFLILTPFLYFVLKYFAYYYFDIIPLSNFDLLDLQSAGWYLFAFFFVAFPTAYILNASTKMQSKALSVSLGERVPIGALLYFLMAITLVILILVGGVSVLTTPLVVREIMTTQGMYYLSAFIDILSIYYPLRLLADKQYYKLGIFGLLYMVYSFVSGRASLQVGFFFSMLLFMGIYYRKPIMKWMLVAIPLGALYVIITGVHRDMAMQESASLSMLVDNLSVLYDNTGNILQLFLERVLHRIDNLEGLAFLSNAINNGSLDIVGGNHAIGFFVQWIPRALWPDKPLNFTATMTSMFRPEVFAAGAGNNFTAIGEGLYNFGLFGVLLLGFAYGVALSFSCNLWRQARQSFALAFLLIAVIYPFMNIGLLAGFVNDLALPLLLIDTVLVYILFRVRVRFV